ncbi:hypothetical protein [Streptomyces sp. NPDC005374]|uniref:hypothetical protein n=1 Tax=Streptomyces sp. NPDC005374 TaxID=3364713 RepID=UPI00368EB965
MLGVAKDEERARSLLRGDLTAQQAFTDPQCTAALDLPHGDPINIDMKRWPDD